MTDNEKQLIHAVILYAEMVKEQARNNNEFPVISRKGLEEHFQEKAKIFNISYAKSVNGQETLYFFSVENKIVTLTINYSNDLYQEHYFKGLVAIVGGAEFYFGEHKHE